MAVLEQLVIRVLFLGVLLCSCTNNNHLWTLSNEKGLDLTKRYVELNGDIYTGYVYIVASNQADTIAISFYNQGLKDGVWKKFYKDGSIKEIREFSAGEKTGKYLGYYLGGENAFEYNFKNGEYHGKGYEWKKDGSLLRESTYEMGYEKGVQKFWWPDGRIKSNYIIKNNRRYGLLGIKNCINVSDSIFSN